MVRRPGSGESPGASGWSTRSARAADRVDARKNSLAPFMARRHVHAAAILWTTLLMAPVGWSADGSTARWWDARWPYRVEVPSKALAGTEAPRALFFDFHQALSEFGHENIARFVSVQAVAHEGGKAMPFPTVTHVKLEPQRERFGYVGYSGAVPKDARLFLYFKSTPATPEEQRRGAALLPKCLPWWVNLYPNPSLELGSDKGPSCFNYAHGRSQGLKWVKGHASHGERYLVQTKSGIAGLNQVFMRLVRAGKDQWKYEKLSARELAGETLYHKIDLYSESDASTGKAWVRCGDRAHRKGWVATQGPAVRLDFSTKPLGRWRSAAGVWTFPKLYFDFVDVCFPVTQGTRGDNFVAQLPVRKLFAVRATTSTLFAPDDDELAVWFSTPSGRSLQPYASRVEAADGRSREGNVSVVRELSARPRKWDVNVELTATDGTKAASHSRTGLVGDQFAIPVPLKGLSPGRFTLTATVFEPGGEEPIFRWSSPARAVPTPYAAR